MHRGRHVNSFGRTWIERSGPNILLSSTGSRDENRRTRTIFQIRHPHISGAGQSLRFEEPWTGSRSSLMSDRVQVEVLARRIDGASSEKP